jgi:hypothetical protein
LANCSRLTPIVTGSNWLIAPATVLKASCAGVAASRQLSGRSGHSIQVWAWIAHSGGMWKPSARGVDFRSRVIDTYFFLDASRSTSPMTRVTTTPIRIGLANAQSIGSPGTQTKKRMAWATKIMQMIDTIQAKTLPPGNR